LNRRGFLLVITAPSGTGKTTIYRHILARHPEIRFSVSYTTREKRCGEVDGEDYFFISREKFLHMIRQNRFLEWAEVHDELKGTEKRQVVDFLKRGNICLLDVDVQGALSIMKNYPDAVTVFIQPPSLGELENRLRKRGTEREEKLRLRLLNAKKELEYAPVFQYIVVNDKVENAVEKIEEIIEKEEKKRG
jgi:guanylate kinase